MLRWLPLLASLSVGCAQSTGAGGAPPRAPAVCSGVACATGDVCCQTTGACFNPATAPEACPPPPPPDGGAPGVRPCAADSQCAADEYCALGGVARLCLGAGICASRTNCGLGGRPVCGCDGVTYPTNVDACQAGVRFALWQACGTAATTDAGTPGLVACGTSAQCPAGQACCAITGACVDPACTTCCTAPPAGTRFPCTTNAQCATNEFCQGGPGCDAPGGCVLRHSSGAECGGAVAQVCGCDGQTYTNACWAELAGTRVAAMGACRDQ